jgi:hypothetical protein
MTANRSAFADAMAPGFRQIFMDALKFGEKPLVNDRIYNFPSTPSVQYVDDSYVTGFGLVSKKTEGAASSHDDFYEGLDTRYTFDTYSQQYSLTKEWMEDERYGLMQKLPKAAGRSMRATIETDGANVFNNGFSSSYAGGPDSLMLFNSSHLFVTGGTQKNCPTNSADLSETSWLQANIDLKDSTDDRGLLLDLKPKKLVFPNEMAYLVKKLFGSPQEYNTGNNAINPVHGESIEQIEWSYLTDSDAWFILCDEHELNWFWRMKPDHYQGNDFDTDNAKFKSRARWVRGWSSPWGLYGSPGA